MTTINTASGTNELSGAVNPSKKRSQDSVEEVQDRFMTLLVTQMKNQDPLNPLDNAQVTSQMAQLSTVTGIDKLNANVSSMMHAYQSSQTLQAASMIGREVVAEGNGVALVNGSSKFSVELPMSADSMTLTIKDAAGNEIQTMEAGRQRAGKQTIEWDGRAADGSTVPDGAYFIEVKAQAGGSAMSATTYSHGRVESVSSSNTGVRLSLAGLGEIELGQVREIR